MCVTSCRAGAQPGQLGTTTARSWARPPLGGIIQPKLLELRVGCSGTAYLPSPSACGEPWCRYPHGCQPLDPLVSRGYTGITASSAGRSQACGFTLVNCLPTYPSWLPDTGQSQRIIGKNTRGEEPPKRAHFWLFYNNLGDLSEAPWQLPLFCGFRPLPDSKSICLIALHRAVGRAELLIHQDDAGLCLYQRQMIERRQHFAVPSFSNITHPSAGSATV